MQCLVYVLTGSPNLIPKQTFKRMNVYSTMFCMQKSGILSRLQLLVNIDEINKQGCFRLPSWNIYHNIYLSSQMKSVDKQEHAKNFQIKSSYRISQMIYPKISPNGLFCNVDGKLYINFLLTFSTFEIKWFKTFRQFQPPSRRILNCHLLSQSKIRKCKYSV